MSGFLTAQQAEYNEATANFSPLCFSTPAMKWLPAFHFSVAYLIPLNAFLLCTKSVHVAMSHEHGLSLGGLTVHGRPTNCMECYLVYGGLEGFMLMDHYYYITSVVRQL